MKSHLTIPIAVLVAALLCYLLLWEQGTDASRQEGESARAVSPGGNPRSDSSVTPPTKLPRPEKSSRPAAAASHTPEKLKDFIIPELRLANVSLQEALDLLFNEYAEICSDTDESPVSFSYELNGSPLGNINLNLTQTSFLSALRLIEIQSGMDLDRDGSALKFTTIERAPDAEQVVRAFHVWPDFHAALHRMLDPDANTLIDDPFSAERPQRPPLQELFERAGIQFPENTNFNHMLGRDPPLIFQGTPQDSARIAALMDALATPTPMITTRIKFIDSSNELELPGGTFSDEEYQSLIRNFSQQKGTDILTQPSITTRPGQSGTIELGGTLRREDSNAPGEFEDVWLGTRINVSPGGYGFNLRTEGSIDDSALSGDAGSKISRTGVSFEGIQQDGMTMLINTTAPDGTPRYAMITTNLVDPAGVPINRDRIPGIAPSDEIPSASDDPFADLLLSPAE